MLQSEVMNMAGRCDNLLYLLRQTVLKLKKKNHTLDNAVSILNEEDRAEVIDLFKQYGV